VLAPDAVIDVDEPLHMDADTGLTVSTGAGFTVTAWDFTPAHPDALVPVTV